MSIKSNAVKIAICFAVGLVCGTVSKALLSTPDRQVASKSFPTKWQPSERNKMLAPMNVEIQAPSFQADSDDQAVEIVGHISLNQVMGSQVDYTWNLPQGVSLVSGQMSDALQGITKNQRAELKIVVTGFSKLSQKAISLSASSLMGNQRIGNSSVIVSRPDETMEASAPELNLQAEEQLGETSGSDSK